MFTIEMLPATAGDCLLIRYGPDDAPRAMLVDGGRAVTYTEHLRAALADRLGDDPVLDLVVVTHIDNDHIFGVLAMLREETLPVRIRDIWFNGYRHLREGDLDALGPAQGDELADLIEHHALPWNACWGEKAVVVACPRHPPSVTLEGGLKLTVLSPTPAGLQALLPGWQSYMDRIREEDRGVSRAEDALGDGIDPNPDPTALAKERFGEDTSIPNLSSIALLAEYDGKRLLLAGDAYPSVLRTQLAAWWAWTRREDPSIEEPRPRIDLLKLSHHGGKGNTCTEMLESIDCERFLVSSDGSGKSRHPSDLTISRIITRPGNQTLYFNYQSPVSRRWGVSRRRNQFSYDARFPDSDAGGLLVEV